MTVTLIVTMPEDEADAVRQFLAERLLCGQITALYEPDVLTHQWKHPETPTEVLRKQGMRW